MTAMKNTANGFTLIELMVAIAMASIVTIVIYSAYNIQTKIYTEQDKTAEMQQNLRAAMFYLQREVRVAGHNPMDGKDKSCNANPVAGPSVAPGIHTASEKSLGFSMDLDGTTKPINCTGSGENVTYSIVDKALVRAAPSQKNPIAENIADIDFLYLLEDSAGNKTLKRDPVAGDYKDIVAVQVSLLAQSKTEDRKMATTSIFTLPVPDWGPPETAKTWTTPKDSNRYLLLTTIINLRNMDLLL